MLLLVPVLQKKKRKKKKKQLLSWDFQTLCCLEFVMVSSLWGGKKNPINLSQRYVRGGMARII